MKHFATPRFWSCYNTLPAKIQKQADRSFALLKENSRHPSLHFKRIGDIHSVRVGLHHRALATTEDDVMLWFWIGSHAEYDQLLSK